MNFYTLKQNKFRKNGEKDGYGEEITTKGMKYKG